MDEDESPSQSWFGAARPWFFSLGTGAAVCLSLQGPGSRLSCLSYVQKISTISKKIEVCRASTPVGVG